MNSQKTLNETEIRGSLDAARVLYDELHALDHEESWALYLTSTNRPIAVEMITCGTLRSTLMDHRRVVKKAILCDAAGVILYHNHPSGEPQPSTADIQETEKLRNACSLFDISLLDHIIISNECFFSFADESKNTYR